MLHQFDEFIVVVAGDIQRTVVLLDEGHGLAHLLCWETSFCHTEIKLRDETECHGITMKDWLALQRPALEGMTEGMSQVQCLADALLVRILFYDALLYLHAVAHHSLQLLQVWVGKVEAYQLFPHRLGRNQAVLQHFGIARTDILGIQGLQELGVENYELRIVENTHLILQTFEVDAGLSTHRCIYHRQQGSRNIDEVDAALEGAGSKTAEVGYHTASEVDHARVT